MPCRRWLAGIGVAITLFGLLSGPAAAGSATDRVRAFFASANRVLTDPEDRRPEERLAALQGLVTEMIEFRAAARIALGSEWTARTPAQQDEFVMVFSDLLQTSVFGSVGGRARIDNGLTVSYIGELSDRDGVTVATTVLARSGNEIAVGYRMLPRDGGWMIYDVVVDGVSLVENYRAQFHKVIQRSSYAGLMGEMRARLVELGRGTVLVSAAVPATPAVPVVSAAPAPLAAPSAPREDIAPLSAPVVAHEPTPTPAAVPADAAPARLDDASPVVAPAAPVLLAAARPPDTARPPAVAAPVRPSIEAEARAMPAMPAARALANAAYWVQVGAFRTDEAAIKVVSALRDQAVSLLQTPDDPLLRVVVGPFTNRQAAVSKLREIRARGFEGFVAELAP